VQSSDVEFPETLVIIPLTSREGADITIKPVFHPDESNGLLEPSSLMTHRIMAIRKSDIGRVIGGMSQSEMERVDAALSLVLGLNRD
jgi:mRNA-degrading endonuclease toxin of MazEF toxin-antitoxin module